MEKQILKELLNLLSEIENGHFYSVNAMAQKYPHWDVLRKTLESTGGFNETYSADRSHKVFAMDASIPVGWIRSQYAAELERLEHACADRRRHKIHENIQDVGIFLSLILSAIALIVSMTNK